MNAQVKTAAPSLNWIACPDSEWRYPGSQTCWFAFNGRAYFAQRTVTTQIVRLCKRERSNSRGTYYSPLDLNGRAAKLVLAAIAKAQP